MAARLEDVQRQLDLRFTAADRALQALARENRDDHQVVTEGLREGREAQQRTADALSSLQVTVAGMSASGAARSTFFEQALKVIGAVTAALALLVSLVGVVVAVVSAVS